MVQRKGETIAGADGSDQDRGLVDLLGAAASGQALCRFAADVRRRLQGNLLRRTEREQLLKLASTLGIGRFEANLIIAMVQHRSGEALDEASAPPPSRLWTMLTIVISIQALIVLGIWTIFGS